MTLRDLPSVHDLVNAVTEGLDPTATAIPQPLLTQIARAAIDTARHRLRAGQALSATPLEDATATLRALLHPSLRSVINATGVVLHTNLGRAPLPALNIPAGYSNLEFDLAAGRRGKRDTHVSALLEAILGAPAVVVNNNAAALFLVLNELASGGEAIVSRGELIEIGDGFRIPEIMQRSGAILREVGTTNRTTTEDYRQAIGPATRVLLRVHRSNFRMTGFTARPELDALVELGKQRGVPVYEDLGSGCLVDLSAHGISEPLAQSSLAAGVDLISFSGDKLLGGPQAGIVAGNADLVARVRRNPLFRALRQDKLFFHAMEPTLRHIALNQLDQVPALRMIRLTAEEIKTRAEKLVATLGTKVSVEPGESVIGGGSTPDLAVPTWLLVLHSTDAIKAQRQLRSLPTPIIARIEKNRVVLDLRTVLPEEEAQIAEALSAL
ncbi:MAG: L-seryl-tRNA(Sec) selenium transferase [Bryobacterales bacterium]|nr:L-seryl-tRNA(Sec) selenium transferase [Bryobacterales bacterium]